MRTLKNRCMLTAVVAGLLATGSSCTEKRDRADAGGGGDAPMLSVLRVAQPGAERQLLGGFWGVENNAWRWTRHEFAVVLMPPSGASHKGARLEFRFELSEGLIARQKSVAITAEVGGVALPAETYTAPCSCVLVRDVPAAAFTPGDAVRVAFTLDKYFPSGQIDGRELGVIANSIGLLAR